MADRTEVIRNVLVYMNHYSITLSEVLLFVLSAEMHETYMNIMLADLVNRAQEILTAFHLHPKTTATTADWTLQLARSCYSRAMQMLTRKEHGWHFSATNTKPEQIHDFRIEDMAEKMRTVTPDLWEMVHFLLSGKDSMDTDTEMELDSREPDLEERQYWESEGMEDVWVGPDEVAAEVQQEEKDQKAVQKKRESREVLTTIVGLVTTTGYLEIPDKGPTRRQLPS